MKTILSRLWLDGNRGWAVAFLVGCYAGVAVLSEEVFFSNTNSFGPEGASHFAILTRTGGTDDLEVTLTTGGTAVAGVDYALFSTNVLIPSGAIDNYFTITTFDNSTEEPDRFLLLSIVPGTNYTIGSQSNMVIQIQDNEPSVTVLGGLTRVSFGDTNNLVARFKRGGDLGSPLTIPLAFGGGAKPGEDFEPLPATVTFPGGQDTADLFVQPRPRMPGKGYRTLIISIVGRSDYSVTPVSSWVAVFMDAGLLNAAPEVAVLAPAPGTAYPSATNVSVSVVASDSDGTVAKLELLLDGVMVTMTTSNRLQTFLALPSGVHSLAGVATDDRGESTRSTPVTVRLGCEPVAGFTAELLLTDALASASKTADGDSESPVFSEDGSKIAFVSQAGDLTSASGLSSFLNIYLHDPATGLNQLVSRSWDGSAGGNGNSFGPMIAGSGRRLLFTSRADNLVTNDFNGVDDVFAFDLTTGKTTLVSVNSAGGRSANGPSLGFSVSADGRFVAFQSVATNLVSRDPNFLQDVFVRDLEGSTTTLASIPVSGTKGASGPSDSPLLSRDGAWVVFGSTATNLTFPGPPKAGSRHIYARNLAASNTVWVSAAAPSTWTALFGAGSVTFQCVNHAISADGRFVVFKASPTGGTNLALIFREDTLSGTTDLIASNALPNLTLETDSTGPTISPDGLWVAYSATSNRVVWDTMVWNASSGVKSMVNGSGADASAASLAGRAYPVEFSANGKGLLLLRDRTESSGLGVLDLLSGRETTRLPIAADDLIFPSLRGDAESMVFASRIPLVSGDRNLSYDVHTFEPDGERLKLVSSVAVGATIHPSSGRLSSSLSAAPISVNGQFLALSSNARIPSSGDTNENRNAMVADLASGSFRVISSTPEGVLANAPATDVAVSADGRKAAFVTAATNLVPYVTSTYYSQVFVEDLASGAVEMASVSSTGITPGNGSSGAPILSARGDWVAFVSSARSLVTSGFLSGKNLFLRDLRSANTFLVPTPTGLTLSPNYFPLGFADHAGDSPRIAYLVTNQTVVRLYVYDHLARANSLVSEVASLPVITPNNRFLSFQTRTGSPNTAALYDLAQLKPVPLPMVLSMGANGSTPQRPTTSASSDGQRLAFVSSIALEPVGDRNRTNDVYLYDSPSGTLGLVSITPSGTAANGPSDTPALSPDGRLVAFRSVATDLVPGGSVGENLFVRDLALATTWLIRDPGSDGLVPKNISAPLFSADGLTLLFSSLTDGRLRSRNVLSARIIPPCPNDVDEDGLDDAWERRYFGDLRRDGSGDYDGDGLSDRDEFLAGTSPTDSTSGLRLEIAPGPAGDLFLLRWPTVLNRAYLIESSPNLLAPGWTAASAVVPGTGQPATLSLEANPAQTSFYRLKVMPQ